MLSIGIVGLPNVGKSTLFKALTNKQVDIQNYPFTTIEPNVGVVAVPDERVDKLASLMSSKKKIYATVDFTDIAGLVKGASEGEGLGNKFLANIREVDAIAHVVRVFDDKNITHVHSKIDPADDIEIIQTELELADLQTKEKRAKEKADKNLPALEYLADKKVIFVLNCSEAQLAAGWQPDEKLLQAMNGREYVILSSPLELILTEAGPDEKKEYLNTFGIKESGLDQLIQKSYKMLGLVTFLTTGEDETRAWTAHEGDPIPKASRAIHTDFERLFIRAEVINWKELLDSGSLANARGKGLLRTVGRDYIIQEGDVVEILIGK
ncbi:YchF family ATPase [Candidatus Parcubacteria bacterium]|nr:YchF family ATPase [Candidatus Parcubacteria bacterium]